MRQSVDLMTSGAWIGEQIATIVPVEVQRWAAACIVAGAAMLGLQPVSPGIPTVLKRPESNSVVEVTEPIVLPRIPERREPQQQTLRSRQYDIRRNARIKRS